MLEKIVLSHLNTDDSLKDLQQGEYIDSVNLLPFSDNSTGVRRRNVRGTELLGTFPVSADAINIGARYFKALNKSYFAFSDKTAGDCIIEYDFNTNQMATVFKNAQLNFDPRHTVELRPVTGLSGNLLYFNDGLPDHARKINIDRAKAGLYDGANFSDVAIAQIRRQPIFDIPAVRATDPLTHLTPNPVIRRKSFQFSLRYVYLDNEISVMGPVSKLVPCARDEVQNSDYNMISLALNIDFFLKPFLQRAELLVREGNTGQWFIYDKLPVSLWPVTDAGITYNFYDDKSGPALSDLESLPLFDSFPRASAAMELHQDRLFETDSLSDYNFDDNAWGAAIVIINGSISQSRTLIDGYIYGDASFMELSKYGVGMAYFDRFGRRVSVSTKPGLFFVTPVAANSFVINDVVSSQKEAINVFLTLNGKPPVWAHYAQPVITPNLSFDWWYASKFAIKFPVNDILFSGDPTTLASQYYVEDGYLYYLNNTDGNTFFQGLIDIVIPGDFPYNIDDTMIIKLAFDYPVGTGGSTAGASIDGSLGTTNFEATVIRIVGNKVRIKAKELVFFQSGIPGVININSWFANDSGDADTTYFSKFLGGIFPSGLSTGTNNSAARLHLLFLHPYSPTGEYLFYEAGAIIPISNPETSSRAFSKTSLQLAGDTYMQAYRYFEDNFFQGVVAGVKGFPQSVKDELPSINGIGYNSISSLADKKGVQFKSGVGSSMGKPNVTQDNPGEKNFGNVVRWTDAYSANTDINGLGKMQSGNKYPVPIERGDITKLISTSENILLAIHARAMTALSVNVRITKSREDNSTVTSDDVIGDNRPVAGDYGTINPESVVCVDGYRVYGFDLNTGEPWRKSLDGLTTLATTYKAKKWFKYKSDVLKAAKVIDPTIDIKIIGGFDPFLNIFYLTFQEVTYMEYPVQITIPPETVAFSELQKGWIGYFDFIPEWFSYNGNNLLMIKDQQLWIHDKDAANCNTFFGTKYDSKVTLVCNMQSDMDKIWENIGLSTNGDWDVTSILTPDGRQTDMIASTFVKRDDVKYSEILRDTTTPPSLLPPGKSARLHGQLMVSQVVSITLRNSDKKEITLDAVYIGFSPVQGHLMSLKP